MFGSYCDVTLRSGALFFAAAEEREKRTLIAGLLYFSIASENTTILYTAECLLSRLPEKFFISVTASFVSITCCKSAEFLQKAINTHCRPTFKRPRIASVLERTGTGKSCCAVLHVWRHFLTRACALHESPAPKSLFCALVW